MTVMINRAMDFDISAEVEKITNSIRNILRDKIKRKGYVVAVSGGIDSSVSAALAVEALGSKKVFALLLPEQDSASNTQSRGEKLVKYLGVDYITHNISDTLMVIGCYKSRDDAIKEVFPEYKSSWKNKIVISGGVEGRVNSFRLVVRDPDNNTYEKRLKPKHYLQIVAATNYKQRIRKTIEYFHADRLNYAVIGTPNRLEYDQGFFVKNGDGSSDMKPIAHLYKTQVYAISRYLGLPDEICNATPTTDTYSLSQGQDEFYFSLSYEKMDIALWSFNHNIAPSILAKELNIDVQHAEYLYKDIETKRKTTRYLHLPPQLVEPI